MSGFEYVILLVIVIVVVVYQWTQKKAREAGIEHKSGPSDLPMSPSSRANAKRIREEREREEIKKRVSEE